MNTLYSYIIISDVRNNRTRTTTVDVTAAAAAATSKIVARRNKSFR